MYDKTAKEFNGIVESGMLLRNYMHVFELILRLR